MGRHHPTLSPSMFPALAQCAGYQRGPAGAAAERGTKIHATVEQMISGRPVEGAYTPAELRYTDSPQEEIEWAVATIATLVGQNPEIEQEVTLLDEDFQEVTFGTIDYYSKGLLVDLKTGEQRDYRGQMAVYALALMDRDGLEEIEVRLVYSKSRTVDGYSLTRAAAESLVWPVVEAVRSSEKRLTPCSYCSWCARKTECPALAGQILPIAQAEIPTYALERFFPLATPEQMAAALDVAAQAEIWAEAVKEEAKRRMAEGLKLPGWRLKSVSGRRAISDAQGAFDALRIEPQIFLKAVTVSLPKLIDAYAAVCTLKKADVKALVEQRLAHIITSGEGYSTIERAR